MILWLNTQVLARDTRFAKELIVEMIEDRSMTLHTLGRLRGWERLVEFFQELIRRRFPDDASWLLADKEFDRFLRSASHYVLQ